MTSMNNQNTESTNLKTWMQTHRIKAWNHKTDSIDIQAWNTYWEENRPVLEKSATAAEMWKEWTSLEDINDHPELKKWIEQKYQTEFYTLQYGRTIEQFRRLWGENWAFQYIAKSPMQNILNDLYCLVEEDEHSKDVAFFLRHYSAEDLAKKIITLMECHTDTNYEVYAKCMKIFEMIISEDDWEYYPQKYEDMMNHVIRHMEFDPNIWHPFLATRVHNNFGDALLSELPTLSPTQHICWRKIVNSIPDTWIPENLTIRHPSMTPQASIESLYTQRLSDRMTTEEWIRMGFAREEYDGDWITQCLEYIQNNKIPSIGWTQWICQQEKTLAQWTNQQLNIASQISTTHTSLHGTLYSYGTIIKPLNMHVPHKQLIDVMFTPSNILHLWKVTNSINMDPNTTRQKPNDIENSFQKIKTCYTLYHAKEPISWDVSTCKQFLMELLTKKPYNQPEEIQKIDVLFNLHDDVDTVHAIWAQKSNTEQIEAGALLDHFES